MSDGTQIEWTDATWNIITGCSVVSPGCTNCYAMKLAGSERAVAKHPSRVGLTRPTKAGPVWTGEVRFNDQWLDQPLRWRRPRKIFVCAHGDLFHENVPDEWLDKVFAVMALAPQHQFQVLTKRPERMREYMDGMRSSLVEGMAQRIWHDRTKDDTVDQWLAVHLPLPNVWLGTSVEDQERADQRIPLLLDTPAAKRWLSCEPLLGPVQLTNIDASFHPGVRGMYFVNTLTGDHDDMCRPCAPTAKIDWVIVGGESGPGARPMHPDWARSLRDQCTEAGVPFLFKQWGDWAQTKVESEGSGLGDNETFLHPDGRRNGDGLSDRGVTMRRIGKKRAGRVLDGLQHDGYPNA